MISEALGTSDSDAAIFRSHLQARQDHAGLELLLIPPFVDYPAFAEPWRVRAGTIDVLFLAESPPEPERGWVRYFYRTEDEGSGLAKSLAPLFGVDTRVDGWKETFLLKFSDRHLFVTDLCERPVDHLGDRERKRERQRWARTLRSRIVVYRPRAVLTLLKSIDPLVRSELTGFLMPRTRVKFPPRYGLTTLRRALRELGNRFDSRGRLL